VNIPHLIQSERAIGDRLRQARQQRRFSRADLAAELAVDAGEIMRVELGRTPLRFGLAAPILERFNLNPRWLAEGTGQPEPFVSLELPEGESVPLDEAFSEVYNSKWEGQIEPSLRFRDVLKSLGLEALLDLERQVRMWPKPDGTWMFGLRPESLQSVRDCALRLAAIAARIGEHVKRIEASADEAEAFFRSRGWKPEEIEVIDIGGQGRSDSKAHLTEVTIDRKTPDVKPKLPSLLRKVASLCQQPGQRSRLAEYLGVPLPRVSEWLNEVHEPGGEVVLRMQAWVENQAGASSGSASATASAKGKREGTNDSNQKDRRVRAKKTN
jgi:transcriptional regulator with XRE-family HTH domain